MCKSKLENNDIITVVWLRVSDYSQLLIIIVIIL